MSGSPPLWRRVCASGHFLTAAIILLVAAAGWSVTAEVLGVVFAKADLPLRKPLDALPETLGRFELARELHDPNVDLHHGKATLTPDVEETLGTTDYISWLYKDKRRSAGGALAYVRLHVAYYTRLLDAVPHVPDQCMVASGYHSAGRPVEVTWTVPDVPDGWASWRRVNVRRNVFDPPTARGESAGQTAAFYVFSVNGEQANDRLDVRKRLVSPFKKYCYYAKIELGAHQIGRSLSLDEQEEMCRAFFSELAPRLLEHLPSADDIRALEASR